MSVATESATGLDWARAQDRADALAAFRGEFCLPPHGDGEQIYLCGNSLGLMPRATRQALNDELDDWSRLAVEAHFHGRHPWMPYHGFVREHLAELVGAQPGEVVAMNSLSANLHLMMVSFYRPSAQRPAILLEKRAFPSDRYALESQVRFHGYDPDQALIELDGDEANGTISLAAIERALHEHGERIALVLLPGVQYLTGQVFDLAAITRLAHAKGCLVGFDLAHAVATCPWICMTAAATSRSGATTSTSTRARARSPAASCMSVMRTANSVRASPAGGVTTRPRVSRWVRNSARRRAPTAGSCRTRRSSRSRRCACRWISSTAPASRGCDRNRWR